MTSTSFHLLQVGHLKFTCSLTGRTTHENHDIAKESLPYLYILFRFEGGSGRRAGGDPARTTERTAIFMVGRAVLGSTC